MSSLHQLRIQGIRSFGPEEGDAATMKFNSPLTIIVGQNGCGKTTIIECLKYATCGELPSGTDSGSGFVNDPSLSGLATVRGQIKLQCFDVEGKKVTVCRTVQATRKIKTVEFKTLDGVFQRGNEPSVSTRCGDINFLMTKAMGVSKAILTNVIFCHQEDSDWPLEKGKKMKDRFDTIFGIAEYNKCLDNIRLQINIVKRRIANDEIEKAANKERRDYTLKQKRTLEDVNNRLRGNREDANALDEKLVPLQEQLKEITLKEMNYADYYAKLQKQKNMREVILTQQKEYQKQVTEKFLGSKQELELELKNFERDLEERKASLDKLEKEARKLLEEEKDVQRLIDREQMRVGELTRDQEQYKEQMKERNKQIVALAKKLKLSVPSEQMSDYATRNMLESIEEKIEDFKEELKRMQREQETKETKLQHEIDAYREKKATLEYDVRSKKQNIDTIRSQIRKLNTEIEQVDRSADTLAKLEKQLNSVTSELDMLKNSLDVEELKKENQKVVKERKVVEQCLDKVEKEAKELQLLSIDQCELDRVRTEIRNRETEIKQLKDKHEATLRLILKSAPPEHNLREQFQRSFNKISEDIKSKRLEISTLGTQLATLESNKKHLSSEIQRRNKEINENEETIENLSRNTDYETAIKDAQHKIQDVQDQKGTLTSSEYLFKRYISKLQLTDPVCPLCHRGFDNKEETESLIEDLTNKLREMPSRLTEVQRELQGLNDRFSRLLESKPLYNSLSTLRTEVSRLKEKENELKVKIETLRRELETKKRENQELEDCEDKAKKIQADVIAIDQNQRELKRLRNDESQLVAKLPKPGSKRSLEEATREQEQLKTKLTAITKQLEKAQYQLSDYNDKLHKLQEEKNKIVAQQLKVEGGVQQRKTLVDKLKDLQESQKQSLKDMEEAESQLAPMVEQFREIDEKMNSMRTRHKSLLEESKKQIIECENRMRDIQKLNKVVQEYEQKGGPASLQDAQDNLSSLVTDKGTLTDKRQKLQNRIDETNKLLSNQRICKLNLECNLNIMKKKEEEMAVMEEINRLEGQTGNISVQNISREKETIKKRIDKLNSEKSNLEGRWTELRNNLAEIERELKKDEYKNAEENYRKSVISVAVKQAAVTDLYHYYRALDYSMISLHKERMKAINTIIRDLWRQIYGGNDIDTIEIKMDATEGSASEKRRAYNYRVVQVKDGVEIDMPGRCSAGQKVLASLIIRIALAETFSRNCGILALDEPTTNLDRENIENVAAALMDIVRTRMVQKNFQLLVITHDEEFMKLLSRVEKADSYLRVSRNLQTGKSVVGKVNLR